MCVANPRFRFYYGAIVREAARQAKNGLRCPRLSAFRHELPCSKVLARAPIEPERSGQDRRVSAGFAQAPKTGTRRMRSVRFDCAWRLDLVCEPVPGKTRFAWGAGRIQRAPGSVGYRRRRARALVCQDYAATPVARAVAEAMMPGPTSPAGTPLRRARGSPMSRSRRARPRPTTSSFASLGPDPDPPAVLPGRL